MVLKYNLQLQLTFTSPIFHKFCVFIWNLLNSFVFLIFSIKRKKKYLCDSHLEAVERGHAGVEQLAAWHDAVVQVIVPKITILECYVKRKLDFWRPNMLAKYVLMPKSEITISYYNLKRKLFFDVQLCTNASICYQSS